MGPVLADLYTPALAVAVLTLAWLAGLLRPSVVALLISLTVVLAFSLLERQLGFWHSWGLDFSTHSAVLLPFYHLLAVLSLLPLRRSEYCPDSRRRLDLTLWLTSIRRGLALAIALLSGVGYGLLMRDLGYHSTADILTTLVSTYPLVWMVFYLLPPLMPQAAEEDPGQLT